MYTCINTFQPIRGANVLQNFFFSLLNSKESRKTKCIVCQSVSLLALPLKYCSLEETKNTHESLFDFVHYCVHSPAQCLLQDYLKLLLEQTQALVSQCACTYKRSRTLNTPGLVNMRSKIHRKWHRKQRSGLHYVYFMLKLEICLHYFHINVLYQNALFGVYCTFHIYSTSTPITDTINVTIN